MLIYTLYRMILSARRIYICTSINGSHAKLNFPTAVVSKALGEKTTVHDSPSKSQLCPFYRYIWALITP